MKAIAKEIMFALLLLITLGTFLMGILHYQEYRDGGLVLSVVSALLFFALLVSTRDDD